MIYFLIKHDITLSKKEEFRTLYESHLRLLEKNGGKIVGDWDVDIGPLCEHIMIWAVEDLTTYERVIQKLAQDPEDTEYKEKGRPLVSNSQRWLLRPTPYSPLK